jgi:uncharacterized protein YukE
MIEHLDRLKTLRKTFQNDWEKCREVWKDEVAARFEEEFVKPWYYVTNELLQQLEMLSRELQNARKNFREEGW